MAELVKTRKVQLEDVAYVNPRLSEKIDPSTSVSFVGMADVSVERAVTEGAMVRPYGEVAKGYTAFRDGDLLVAKITPCFENGKIGQATLSHRLGFGSTEFHVVRPRPELADARFLLHFLRSPQFRASGEMRMTGSGGQRRVPVEYVKQAELLLPPLNEQRRVAAILDKADEIRMKRRQALAHLDQLPQSIFRSMFGDPTNPEPEIRVSNVGSLSNVIVPTRDKPTQFGGDIPWVTLPDLESMFKIRNRLGVSPDSPNILSNRLIPERSILLSCAGTVGRVAVTMKPVHANQQFYGIVPNTDLIDTIYLAYSLLLRGEHYYAKLGGSFTISFFSKEKAKSIPVPVPPHEIQIQFARRVVAIERIRDKVLRHLSELDALCSSLQHRAFNGEL